MNITCSIQFINRFLGQYDYVFGPYLIIYDSISVPLRANNHPHYLNVWEAFDALLLKYKETAHLKDWGNHECRNFINEVIILCQDTDYFTSDILPKKIDNLPLENIKSTLLRPEGLDIETAVHPEITIDAWAGRIHRYFQLNLIFACRKKKQALLLGYTKP